jgi:hypothetical protein
MVNRHKYAAKMDQKRQDRLAVGIVSDRFPNVSSIVINMTYFQKGPNPVLMERTVNIFPGSDAYFIMDCMTRGCLKGGYDLTPVVNDMVKNHKAAKKGALVCGGTIDVPVVGHARIEYEILVRFQKVPR